MDDEISQGPDRPGWEFRLPQGPRRWLAVAGVIGLVAVAGVYGVSRFGGQPVKSAQGRPTGRPTVTASPFLAQPLPDVVNAPPSPPGSVSWQMIVISPQLPLTSASIPPPTRVLLQPQSVATGTVLLTCASAHWLRLPRWQAGSLRAGALWFVGGREDGYASPSSGQKAAFTAQPGGGNTVMNVVEMLVHVNPGSTVELTAPAYTWPNFQFLNTPASAGDVQGSGAGHGYTFAGCPAASHKHPGMTAFYQVGFSIEEGSTATVAVRSSASEPPVWVTLKG